MKWADYKKQLKSLDQEELEQIAIVAQLITRRKVLGLTQRDLAEMTGLKQAAIARLEREGAIPRLDTLEKIAKALNLKLVLIDENAVSKDMSISI
ncbi:helix-turn-helix domain-containing protein [Bacillus sp. JJ722]|uniref:helix-turn-helix domain-containing protein n=1 Tax=Bacillus sp. JJ722 TaxID=3122973 RepID=UPI002FFE966A